jgi:hypothetical protein
VISEKTTRIIKPLTSDGQIDFLRYVEEKYYPKELATDENGFRLFVQKTGCTFSNNEFYKQQMYQKLGLDINIKPFADRQQKLIKKSGESRQKIVHILMILFFSP